MAKYFRYFPKTPYILEKNGDLNLVTNVITRVKFLDSIKNIISSYFLYDIGNEDTPETLAYKFYGSSEKHWIILLLNEVVDPQFDWYKNYEFLNRYIDKKYETLGGLAYARSNIYQYLIDETRTVSGFGEEPTQIIETRETDRISWEATPTSSETISMTNSNNYTLSIQVTKRTKSYYEYEIEENEKKRSIKVLKKEYIGPVENELKSLLGFI